MAPEDLARKVLVWGGKATPQEVNCKVDLAICFPIQLCVGAHVMGPRTVESMQASGVLRPEALCAPPACNLTASPAQKKRGLPNLGWSVPVALLCPFRGFPSVFELFPICLYLVLVLFLGI